MPINRPAPRPARVFFTALVMSLLVFLPFIIYNKGMFLYYGDFNVQQIPFYMHVHDALLNGRLGWDPITDLGVDLLTSYSFYCITSPFFLVTLAFPASAIPYLMAPLLVLKTACAALAAYYYLIRFVHEEFYARIGALLYAFSGFMTYNIFFNHFHEAILFFPLMLIGLEELLVNRRRGFFAIAVGLCAVVNYWFFIGEVVFVVFYFFVRTLCDKEHCPLCWGRFFHVTFEGALGVMLAAGVFLPSVLAIMGNPRTAADTILNGWSLWYYSNPQRYLAILHSLFFPPDMSSLPNFFTGHGAKWASLSAYLPMVGVCGVVVFLRRKGLPWLRRMLAVCAAMAVVPVLNAAFVLFNNSYYARWYYMPLLLMCAATAQAMEQAEEQEWVRPLGLCLGVVCAFAVVCGLTPVLDDGEWSLGLADNPLKMWLSVALALLGLLLTGLLFLRLRRHERFKPLLGLAVGCFAVVYSIACMAGAVSTFHNNSWIREQALPGRGNITLPDAAGDNSFYRVDFYDGDENMGLYWELPSIQAFQSVVPVSIMEFYPEVGVTRDVSSKPSFDKQALRPFLSVKYLFVNQENTRALDLENYTLRGSQYGYDIYENNCWLPLGFSYDYYVTESQWGWLSDEERCSLLLRAVVLEDEAISTNGDILQPLVDDDLFYDTSDEQMLLDVAERRSMASLSTEFVDGGFSAQTDFDQSRLMFFAVPYSEGWSAYVDGRPAEILKANIGFMAIRVPAGQCSIRLEYHTPGLGAGLALSGLGLVVLVAWMAFGQKLCARLAVLAPKRAAEAYEGGGEAPAESAQPFAPEEEFHDPNPQPKEDEHEPEEE